MPSKIMGIKHGEWDDTVKNDLAVRGLIYDRWDHLTNDYYTKNVKIGFKDIDNSFTLLTAQKYIADSSERVIFVLGEVEEGTYLTTTIIPGVAQPTLNKAAAFAVATESRKIKAGEPFLKVGAVHVNFL